MKYVKEILTYLKRYKFNSIFIRNVLAIWLAFVIPFSLLGALFYQRSSSMLEREWTTVASERAIRSEVAAYNFIQSMNRLSSVILNQNLDVQKVMSIDEQVIKLSGSYEKLISDMSVFSCTYGYIKSIGVYSQLNDRMIDQITNRKAPDKNRMLFKKFYESIEPFYFYTTEEEGETNIMFVRRKIIGNEYIGMVFISVYLDSFFENIGIGIGNTDDVLAIYKNGEIFIKSSKSYPIDKFLHSNSRPMDATENRADSNYIVTVKARDNVDWDCMYLYNKHYYQLALEQMQMFLIWLMICMFFISLVLALYIGLRTFKPFVEISEYLYAHKGYSENDMNELGFITRNILSMVSENMSLNNEMRQRIVKLNKLHIYALQSQINPHFLHNALETIKWLVVSIENDNSVASSTIDHLSKIMKYSLNMRDYLVDLDVEIEAVKKYIEIMQVRYEDKFEVVWDVPENRENLKIIKLSLQPIVENAISHGIIPTRKKGSITITISTEDNTLKTTVKDTGRGMEKADLDKLQLELRSMNVGKRSRGIGLLNVNMRIKLICGENYGVSVLSENGLGTAVVLTMKI